MMDEQDSYERYLDEKYYDDGENDFYLGDPDEEYARA
jgi:hypothetical protein